ncbi:hypothetical protein RvY_15582 [Ramazzottius varieornatus]|uniref:Uncharacterized protein n=1 Tax=Ramazzottius varieornatus TaxID=947166 RepID=A0A1D1W3D0_RAMVA|nr:hypothetical protein RvY_15582 [Ramazzottius varieornatus]
MIALSFLIAVAASWPFQRALREERSDIPNDKLRRIISTPDVETQRKWSALQMEEQPPEEASHATTAIHEAEPGSDLEPETAKQYSVECRRLVRAMVRDQLDGDITDGETSDEEEAIFVAASAQ